jgi:AcrR family transcriptional regulator
VERNPAQGERSRGESADQTRVSLLEAGYEILREEPVAQVVRHVSAVKVCQRAGVTTGAFYYHWKKQDLYRQDLIEYALSEERYRHYTDDANERIAAALSESAPLEQLIRVVANADFDSLKADRYFALQMGLWARYMARDDLVDVRELLHRQYRDLEERWIPMYQGVLDAQGLEPRPPFSVESIATVFTALVEGLAIRYAIDPERVPDELPPVKGSADGVELLSGRWTLFSTIVLSLLPMMTTPVARRDSPLWRDGYDVREVVRSLRLDREAFGLPDATQAQEPERKPG